jgi:hypothetical protein
MLATVTIDGIMETPLWAGTVERILGGPDGVDAGSASYLLLMSALLAAGPLVLAGFYFAVAATMAHITGGHVLALAGLFVLSLVPIAIGYHLSHYVSLLLVGDNSLFRWYPIRSDTDGICSARRYIASISASSMQSRFGTSPLSQSLPATRCRMGRPRHRLLPVRYRSDCAAEPVSGALPDGWLYHAELMDYCSADRRIGC